MFNVQYSLFSGEETACFDAIIYLDNKFAVVRGEAWFPCPVSRAASFSLKHEIRISKSETNPKCKCSKFKTKASLYGAF
jgi:hypothetical protein